MMTGEIRKESAPFSDQLEFKYIFHLLSRCGDAQSQDRKAQRIIYFSAGCEIFFIWAHKPLKTH